LDACWQILMKLDVDYNICVMYLLLHGNFIYFNSLMLVLRTSKQNKNKLRGLSPQATSKSFVFN
jgi:hypothetical protein